MHAALAHPEFTSRLSTLAFAGAYPFDSAQYRYDHEDQPPGGKYETDGGIGTDAVVEHCPRLEPGSFANLRVRGVDGRT
jgi:hypothetical protein